LLGGDNVARVQALNATHAGADPHAGRLASLRVVGRQSGVALLGGVHRRHLPGQVLIPVPSGDLVQAHHAALTGQSRPQWTGAHDRQGRGYERPVAIGALTRENTQHTTDATGVSVFALRGYVGVSSGQATVGTGLP
jgi:hypothetical protein